MLCVIRYTFYILRFRFYILHVYILHLISNFQYFICFQCLTPIPTPQNPILGISSIARDEKLGIFANDKPIGLHQHVSFWCCQSKIWKHRNFSEHAIWICYSRIRKHGNFSHITFLPCHIKIWQHGNFSNPAF